MAYYLKLVFLILWSLFFHLQIIAQTFSSSNLPLVVINTNGLAIQNTPKIMVEMGIIWKENGNRNSLKDPKNNYNGKVGIEIRGSSSQQYPKKSYGFETRLDEETELNVSLLGLPAESDWVLYAPYTDKTMIRDVLTYILNASFGHYSPRCRFVELFINDNYEGVYVLMEKIKRDENRVDIAKLKPTDNSGEDLTGGYIIKIDKTTGGTGEGWSSEYINKTGRTYYQYEYPEDDEITIAQKTYIQAWLRNMEQSLYFQKFNGTGNYHEYLNDSSFIDFMITNELSKNIDGYRLSSFLYKDKNEKLNCGPIWDFNLSYGNANYHQGWLTTGFQYRASLSGDYFQNPFWWEKLMLDQNFVFKLKNRWNKLREKQLSTNRIHFVTDSLVNLLSEAETRNYQRWPIIGKYVWPNYYIGTSYEEEVLWMKNWINNRLLFIDQAWMITSTEKMASVNNQIFSVFPNPFVNELNIQTTRNFEQICIVKLLNSEGKLISQSTMDLMAENSKLNLSNSHLIQPGIYIIEISMNGKNIFRQKIVKKSQF
jgi:hypothetical protein